MPPATATPAHQALRPQLAQPRPAPGYGPAAAADPMLVFELTDRVRETVQGTLYRLLLQRRSVWR